MRTLKMDDLVFSGSGWMGGWFYNKIKGWYGFEDVEQESDSIEGRNGSFFADQSFLESTIVSVQGVFVGSTTAEANEARARLAGLRNGGREIVVIFDDEYIPTSRNMFVRRAIPDNNQHSSFEFTVDLVAYDPFRYGEPVTLRTGLAIPSEGGLAYPITYPLEFGIPESPGSIKLSNFGREATSPSFVVQGQMEGGVRLRRQEDGTSIWFRRNLAETDILELDPEQETATINGIDASVYLTVERWPKVQPNDTATIQFIALGATSGLPELTGKISPAYL